MKIYCVTYVENGATLEMCYPAMDAEDARNMCKDDMDNVKVVNVEEVL
jgi:hypothetical protein